VLYGRPEAALITGVAGLVLHWLLTAKPQHDGELADASYFFGFLLTLIFLAAGLVSLGSSIASGPAVVVGFLKDLGAGLVLTIVGLLMRQMRTALRGRAHSTDAERLADRGAA
jgi:ABC-type Fe3+ transport system permease subunit